MGKIESRKRHGVIKTSWKLIKALSKSCESEELGAGGDSKGREIGNAVQPKDLLPTWLNNYRRLSKAPLQMRAATKYGATWLLATCGSRSSSSSSSWNVAAAAVAAFVHFDAAQLIFNAVG